MVGVLTQLDNLSESLVKHGGALVGSGLFARHLVYLLPHAKMLEARLVTETVFGDAGDTAGSSGGGGDDASIEKTIRKRLRLHGAETQTPALAPTQTPALAPLGPAASEAEGGVGAISPVIPSTPTKVSRQTTRTNLF